MSQIFKKINITNLKLDFYNPRLPKSKQGADTTETTIINWMLLEAATLELMTAIGQNGYFSGEQLLVVKDELEEDKYIVVEGNRRLTAVKLLSNPVLADVKKQSIKEVLETTIEKPTEIPCLIFEEKSEILKYLGFRHITGIKTWRLLEKARYLFDLKDLEFKDETFTEACKKLARMIGSSSSYIRRLLIGYELYKIVEDEGFYNIEGLNDTRFYLSYFSDSLNKENIRKYIGIDIHSEEPLKDVSQEHLKEITHWWFEKKEGVSRVIGDSRGLKNLDSIIGNESALAAFKKGEKIEDALLLTNEINLLFQKEIERSLKSIENADSLSTKVTNFYNELYDDLKTIRKIAVKIKEFQEQIKKGADEF